MASTVKIKRSAVPGKVPVAGDLDLGELAINTYDGKLYMKKSVSGTESIVDITSGGLDGATILSLLAPVDGSGSGLDADLLDGEQGSFYQNASNINAGTLNAARLAASGVTAGSYGSATAIPVLTVDAAGRVTAASTTSITVGDGTLTVNTSGVGLSGSGTFTANQSGNGTITITSNATNLNTASTIVARDASGNFAAGTITGTLSGNASTATTLQTARTIALSGDVSGSASFNGSANITISATVADDSHNHVISNVDGLQTALDGKAALSHTHASTQITDFVEAVQDLIGADVIGGTGIAVSYDDTTGDTTVTNTAPDQVVALTGAGATSVSGTYPNFTITSTDTNTTYSAGGGLTLSGTTFSHSDTSAQASVNNAGAVFIQDVTLDTYGHVTGLGSVTVTPALIGAAAASHGHAIADVTGLQTALDAKASITYVDTAVANLVDTAPAALDTLNELAAALGDDPNFAATVSTQIGTKLDATANAVSASKWLTARTITLGGDLSGSVSIDGSANVTLTASVLDDSHNHVIANVDGLQTALDSKLNLSGGTLSGTLNYRMLSAQSTASYDTAGDASGFSVFYGTSTATGKPAGTDHAVTTLSYSDLWQVQEAADWRTNARYIRKQENGTWSAWQRLFADDYHPNADKLTTARTIALSGDVSGSASFDGSANITISAVVADDSHNHIISNVDGLQAALDLKAPLASPALTGTPTAPTAAVGTNTTQLATTAFVQAEIANDAPTKTGGGASGTWGISVTGNAGTATTLQTARTIALSGAATGTATSFNGSANITIPVTDLNASNLNAGTVPDARLSGTYSGITLQTNGGNTHVTTPNSGSPSTNDRTVFGLAQFKSDSSAAVGAIVFIAPNTNSTIMHRMKIEGMLYTGGPTVCTVIQGYRTTGAWSNTSKLNLGITDLQVRWGVTPDGKNCIILGDVGTSWSYPMLAITHAMFSHSGVTDAYCKDWTVALVTDLSLYTNVTGSLANSVMHSGLDAADLITGTVPSARLSGTYAISISGSSASATGNAGTATTLQTARTINGTSFNGSANITTANWGTARTLTIGSTGKSVNGSANVSWSLAEIGAAAASHTHTLASLTDTSITSPLTGDVLYYNGTSWVNVDRDTAGIVTTSGNQTVAGVKTFSSTITGSVSGNAGTATTLQTARTINGTSFNGSANITTANWGTARTLSFTGDVTGSASVNGSANVATAMTLANSGATAGTYTNATITVDAKGRVTSASSGTSGGLSITNDTATASARYLTFTASTSGSVTGANVSSTKLTFTPSTGALFVSGDVQSTSDIRVKTEIEIIEDALAKVQALRGVTFTRKDTGVRQTGLIAQEVQPVLPEAVAENEDGLTLAYGNMVGLLVEAIKELAGRVEQLEGRVA